MLFLLSDENQITSQSIRNFVSFTWKHDWMIVRCTLFNRNFHSFVLFEDFFSFALFAFGSFGNYLSLSTAFVTGFLNLLVHSWAHLIHLALMNKLLEQLVLCLCMSCMFIRFHRLYRDIFSSIWFWCVRL